MLAVARAKTPSSVRLVQTSVDRLPFADAAFDVVVSTSVFHYFRRPQDALGEARRVLRPGGRLVITDWCDDFIACHACDLILRLFDRTQFRGHGYLILLALISSGTPNFLP